MATGEPMEITAGQVRAFRLRAHHLDEKRPMDELLRAAGACGLQNTPPGAWETALFNRLAGCSLPALQRALSREKILLQAWSRRGVPLVFPTAQSQVFLAPLVAREGEQPWIYTLGISGALEHLQMPFDDLLQRLEQAIGYLDHHTVQSKEALDQTLAELVCAGLPRDKQALWRCPSIYGKPETQTMGAAAVSFLLRPCSFLSLVVFGERLAGSPGFTSYKNWVGHPPAPMPEAENQLVRSFLHCYGPATSEHLMHWLGCSPAQARRLWQGVAEETQPVTVAGKTRHLLAADADNLRHAGDAGERLLLLGPHDPYLELRDRELILEDKTRQKTVWQYVSNPGAVLRGGRVIGVWKVKTLKDKLDLALTLWEKTSQDEQRRLKSLGEEYAAFRQAELRNYTVDG